MVVSGMASPLPASSVSSEETLVGTPRPDLRAGTSNQQPTALSPSKVDSGMAPSPPTPSTSSGLNMEGLPRPVLRARTSIPGQDHRLFVEAVVTPRKVKGRRELLNLDSSINYDAKGAFSRQGKGKLHAV